MLGDGRWFKVDELVFMRSPSMVRAISRILSLFEANINLATGFSHKPPE